MKQALGILQVQGLVHSIACADAALKAANIELLGYESCKGGAKFAVKFVGNVGAVKAAVDAGLALAGKVGGCAVGFTIPRPSDGCWDMVNTENINEAPMTEAAVFEEAEAGEPEEKAETPEEPEAEAEVPEEKAETPEEPEAEAEVSEEAAEEAPEDDSREGVCNLCKDPKCPRRKGEPHNLCIHFEDK